MKSNNKKLDAHPLRRMRKNALFSMVLFVPFALILDGSAEAAVWGMWVIVVLSFIGEKLSEL